MTNTNEVSLLKAAQDFLRRYDLDGTLDSNNTSDAKAAETLRQAVEQAKGVEAVAWLKIHEDGNKSATLSINNPSTRGWQPLYTTPPSVDALIAEIDGLGTISWGTREQMDGVDYDELKAVLDKYRSVK